jgi:hypothetical protein
MDHAQLDLDKLSNFTVHLHQLRRFAPAAIK